MIIRTLKPYSIYCLFLFQRIVGRIFRYGFTYSNSSGSNNTFLGVLLPSMLVQPMAFQ